MPESFSIKTIRLEITLGKGQFSEGGNTRVIEGLACEVSVTKPGLPEKNSATIKVWGLKYDAMAQLTTLASRPLEYTRNLVSIWAGDLDSELALVFSGEVTIGFADFNAAPDVCMQFEAETGIYPQQIAEPVITTQGPATADALFSQFSAAMGYTFKNEGLTTQVNNGWYPGSPLDKALKLSRDINCELFIDDGAVIVMPAGQARQGNATLLSKSTGLIGYPTFNQDGISCRCIFNPDLSYGGLIKVESIVPRATGTWRITKLSHSLSAYTPGGGNWESQVEGVYYG